MEILGYYLRAANVDVVETALQVGDEVHFFNGELFVVRRVSENKWNALSIKVMNGAKAARAVDTLSVDTEDFLNETISLILDSTRLTAKFLGVAQLSSRSRDPTPLIRFEHEVTYSAMDLQIGDQFLLYKNELYLTRAMDGEWYLINLILRDFEGHSVHDKIAVSSEEEISFIVESIIRNSALILFETNAVSFRAAEDAPLALYELIGNDGPPEDFFERKPAK